MGGALNSDVLPPPVEMKFHSFYGNGDNGDGDLMVSYNILLHFRLDRQQSEI